jgi:anti-sigma28 factor (negative regulator of flagellin synthesis)
MNIGAVQAYGAVLRNTVRQKSADKPPARAAGPVRDTFEPSTEAGRAAKLAEIKQRIKAGYYSSNEVAEDLSDSFAKVFDKLV